MRTLYVQDITGQQVHLPLNRDEAAVMDLIALKEKLKVMCGMHSVHDFRVFGYDTDPPPSPSDKTTFKRCLLPSRWEEKQEPLFKYVVADAAIKAACWEVEPVNK